MRFSSVVGRYRRWVVLAALTVCVGAVAGAVRSSSEPRVASIATAVLAAVALLTGAAVGTAFRWREDVRFEVDETRRTFRTPRGATPVFVTLVLLAAMALVAEVGGWAWAHGNRDVGWVVFMVLFGAPIATYAAVAWRGHGVSLTPDGIRADLLTGSLVVPWTALSSGQPRPVTPQNRLDLLIAHPDRVVKRGLLRRRNRIFFEGPQPAFVAAAIRHYAAHPDERPGIGTRLELCRIVELLAEPPRRPPPPPPSRRRVALLATAGVLVFGLAVAGDTWVDVTIGRDTVLGYAADFLRQTAGWVDFYLFAAAVNGIRARRRPALPAVEHPAPPAPDPAKVGRPSWARDVTNT